MVPINCLQTGTECVMIVQLLFVSWRHCVRLEVFKLSNISSSMADIQLSAHCFTAAWVWKKRESNGVQWGQLFDLCFLKHIGVTPTVFQPWSPTGPTGSKVKVHLKEGNSTVALNSRNAHMQAVTKTLHTQAQKHACEITFLLLAHVHTHTHTYSPLRQFQAYTHTPGISTPNFSMHVQFLNYQTL